MADPFDAPLPSVGQKPWTLNPAIIELRGRQGDIEDIIETGRLSPGGLADELAEAAASVEVNDTTVANLVSEPTSDTNLALVEQISNTAVEILPEIAVPVGQSAGRLARWDRKIRREPATAKIMFFGDSTSNGDTGPSGPLYGRIAGIQKQGLTVPPLFHTAAGQGLAGMTADTEHFIDAGSSGIKAVGVLTDYDNGVTTSKSLRWALAQAPDVVVISLGINDLKQQERSMEQLRTDLVRIVEIWRSESPNTDIILRVPNSLLTTNYNNLDYVRESPTGVINPDGLAQTISERLRSAYLPLVDQWPNVVVADMQAAIFGTKALPYAAGGLMSDQIHPGQAGQYAIADFLVEQYLGLYPRRQLRPETVALAAVANSPYSPWTITPAVLDEPERFVRVGASDSSADSVAGSRQTLGSAIAGDFSAYDIVRMPDGSVYQLPSNSTFSQNGQTARLNSNQALAHQPGTVEVFRQVKTGDAVMDRNVFDKSRRFRKFFRVVSATANSVTLRPVSVSRDKETTTPTELAALIATGNLLYLAGAGSSPVELTAGQWSVSGANIVVSSLATDYTGYVGRMAAITGTQSSSAPGATGPAGPAGGIAAPMISGRGAIPAVFGSRSATAGTLGTEYAVPIVFSANGSVTGLAIDVATAVTGSAARVGFRSSVAGLPGVVLADGGAALDCSTTGLKLATFGTPVSVLSGTVYWLSVWLVGSAAANLRVIAGISPLIAARSGVSNEEFASIAHTKGSTDGALADWDATFNNNGFAPLVRAIIA